MHWILTCLYILLAGVAESRVKVGLEVLCEKNLDSSWKGKRVVLLTHAAAIDRALQPAYEVFQKRAKDYTLAALWAPEHGLDGDAYAAKPVADGISRRNIPIFSLHGDRRRPTEEMLRGVDIVVIDLQDIGLRYYTYISSLFYCMEEASKRDIEVVVLDRPNPLGGMVLDGTMLEDKWRSFLGYVNVPVVYGMTIGELARLYKGEYGIGCRLKVVAMEGWKRKMTFAQTGRPWIPTSPNIPEADTPMYCAITGIIGELGLCNIGIGYTMPFKLIGAPWIRGEELASRLAALQLPGVRFRPISYKPMYGKFKNEMCHGVQILISDWNQVRPQSVSFALMCTLKELYPQAVDSALRNLDETHRQCFQKVLGTQLPLQWLSSDKAPYAKMLSLHKQERLSFFEKRKQYLLPQYD